jgi:ABC-type nickel/cobalt efflux system permease component RcnA
MMNRMFLSVLTLGFVLGLRHALDPDHMVAVSTIVSESRSLRRSSLVGTLWGLGHMLSLLCAGIIVIALKVQISDRTALWMEFVVALMLILLGVKSMLRSLHRWKLHRHRHTHDGSTHTHLHLHRHGHEHVHRHHHLIRFSARPLVVGMVHGMAGSAALTLLVLATIPSTIAGLIYITIFGLGSVGGMLIMSSLISLPFVLTRKRFMAFSAGLQIAVGLFSVGFGLFLAWQYGFQEHLIL